ncbi:MAG: cytochrome c-type biogenesis protein [Pseudomonadales bacterium]
MANFFIPSLLGLMILVCGASVANTVEDYTFANDAMRDRYQNLIDELRCPQCLNTNLAGSDAMIAANLRREVYRMVTSGETDEAIKSFMYERYGDFILYRPRLMPSTWVLWLLPGFLLIVGVWVWWVMARLPSAALDDQMQMSDTDLAEVERLLGEPHRANDS